MMKEITYNVAFGPCTIISLKEFLKRVPRVLVNNSVFSRLVNSAGTNTRIQGPIYYSSNSVPTTNSNGAIAYNDDGTLGGSITALTGDITAASGTLLTTSGNNTLQWSNSFTSTQELYPLEYYNLEYEFKKIVGWESTIEFKDFPEKCHMGEYIERLSILLAQHLIGTVKSHYYLVRIAPRTYLPIAPAQLQICMYYGGLPKVVLSTLTSICPPVKFPRDIVLMDPVELTVSKMIQYNVDKHTPEFVLDKMLLDHPNPNKKEIPWNPGYAPLRQLIDTGDFKQVCMNLVGHDSTMITRLIAENILHEYPIINKFVHPIKVGLLESQALEQVTEVGINYLLLIKLLIMKDYLPNLDMVQNVIANHPLDSRGWSHENIQVQFTAFIHQWNTEPEHRYFYSQLMPKQIIKVLSDADIITGDYYDTINQIYKYKLKIPKKWATIKSLHDQVSALARISEAKLNAIPFTYTDKQKALHGHTWTVEDTIVLEAIGDEKLEKPDPHTYRLELPFDSADMVQYGTNHHNCVASYKDKVISKSSLIVGIYLNGKHTWTAELGEVRVGMPYTQAEAMTADKIPTEPKYEMKLDFRQIRGEYNKEAEQPHYDRIIDAIKKIYIKQGGFDLNVITTSFAGQYQQPLIGYQAHINHGNHNVMIGNQAQAVDQNGYIYNVDWQTQPPIAQNGIITRTHFDQNNNEQMTENPIPVQPLTSMLG